MNSLESYLKEATAPGPNRQIPGCVLIVADKDGITYSNCFGTQSVDPDSPLSEKPLSLYTPMWYASCTKVMTAVAVLQCVEKGLLSLNNDISDIIHEYKEPQILKGFDEMTGEPILMTAKGRITLRQLLTHQSGLGYSFMDPMLGKLSRYKEDRGQLNPPRLVRTHGYVPLLFEPGTSWAYGLGSDWAGQMVERVTHKTLEAYMYENIWMPLGMKSTTFRVLENNLEIASRRTDMSTRQGDGTLIKSLWAPDDTPDDFGGFGLYSCAEDYVKVLIALLKNDGTLLKPESVDMLFEPCLSDPAAKKLQEIRDGQSRNDSEQASALALTGGIFLPTDVNFALGGMIAEQDLDGGRRKGSLGWGGLPNLVWAVDRESNKILLYASQLFPSGDAVSRNIFAMFEKAAYKG